MVGGAELFTGNNLIVMAWANKKVTGRELLRNWGIVYLGNFVGSLGTVALMFFTRQYTFGASAVGITALKIGVTKVDYTFLQAVALGILCNGLVCLAVWLTYSARSTADKILAILFPITAFVAAGFEHSVANMYFIPYALTIKYFDPTVYSLGRRQGPKPGPADLAGVLRQKPHPGHHRQHPRRRPAGGRHLLGHLPAPLQPPVILRERKLRPKDLLAHQDLRFTAHI